MKKTINEIYSELSSLIQDVFCELAPEIFIKTNSGIVIYNRYLIRKQANSIDVLKRSTEQIKTFGSMKTAVTWTLLDNYGRINDALRVEQLDKLIDGVNVDIIIHKDIVSKKVGEQYFIAFCKLQHDISRQKQIISERDKYMILARQLCANKRIKS